MRWGKKSRRPKYLLGIPCIHAREIIVDAHREGFINWNVYQRVMEKINSNQNGGWMFEKGRK